MFDWNDQNQVGDTIWGDFSENEDHIVPYPKRIDETSLCTFGDYSKKQRNEEGGTIIRSLEKTSGAKNEIPECTLKSGFNRNKEVPSPRLEMDIWPDLPSLNAALSKGYNDENGCDDLGTGLMNTFSEASKIKVQLDGEPDLFGGEHGDKESDNFLDCYWDNFGDFDDLDRIFRSSESIFDHEMVGSTNAFLSPSKDIIGGSADSIPMPDIPTNEEPSSDKGCSSFQYGELCLGKENSDEKEADHSVKTEEQTVCPIHLARDNRTLRQSPGQMDRQKRLLRLQKKADEKSKIKASQNRNDACSHNFNQTLQIPAPKGHASVTTPLQMLQSPATSQQMQIDGTHSMGYPSSSNSFMISGFGYSMYPYPTVPQLPHAYTERNKRKPVSVGYKYYPDSLKQSEAMNKMSDSTKLLTMTPQEKIEKLRRRQQTQAMLAIQQQRQQFGHQITGGESMVSQACIQKDQTQDAIAGTFALDDNTNKMPSSHPNILDQDDSQSFSMMIDDHSLSEATYNQLQDALGKIDIKVRLCIRDSLFRLASSAKERQNASDRSSTNASNRDEDEVPASEETNQDRSYPRKSSKLSDAETDTNPIDRTVAHLVFHNPSESCPGPMQEEIPNSPISFNPDIKPSLNTCGSTSEE